MAAIEVELYTRDHLVKGTVDSTGERLSDILNNKTESDIVLRAVEMTRLVSLGKVPPLQLPVAKIEKKNLLLAVPVAARDLTHKSLYKRAARQAYEIMVFLPNFEIHGTIHLTERLDLRRVFIVRTDDYIPLTNATAAYVLHPKVVIKSNTIIFNKNTVIMLGEPLFSGGKISRL